MPDISGDISTAPTKNFNAFYGSTEYLPPRKSDCWRAPQNSRPVVMLIPELSGQSPTPCSYIRVLEPLLSDVIKEQFDIRVETLESALSVAASVVIVNRLPCDDVSGLTELFAYLKRTGARLIYEIDDQLLNLNASHPEKHAYQPKAAVVLRLLAEADMVWMSTRQLERSLRPLCRHTRVIENYVSPELIPTCERKPSRGEKFRILYMGTKTHRADLNLVLSALDNLRQKGTPFELTLVGITTEVPKKSWITAIDPPAAATSYPLFMEWLKTLPAFDLGIAPLEPNEFNQCKSAIKYWDYTALGIPVLASDYGPYKEILKHGENGLLADSSAEDWEDKLSIAINNQAMLDEIVQKAQMALKRSYAAASRQETRQHALVDLFRSTSNRMILNKPDRIDFSMTREVIANAFLCGDGIEIGALHNPLAVPKNARVKFVDRIRKEKLYEHYPELRKFTLVDIDIVDDGETLNTISDSSQDFVIANHFIEHSEDPIQTIRNMLRVLKVGGALYLAVPDRRKTFDSDRGATPLDHLMRDHFLGVETSRRTHYEEWVALVEPHFGRSYDKTGFSQRVDELLHQKYSIHFHCWDPAGFFEFLRYLQQECALPFELPLFIERVDEFIAVMRKVH